MQNPPPLLLGVDFSSSPSRRKPIVMARGERAGTRVHLRSLETFETLDALGRWLALGVGGWFDLPLGLPRELVQQLGWPQVWSACMRHYGQPRVRKFAIPLLRSAPLARPGPSGPTAPPTGLPDPARA